MMVVRACPLLHDTAGVFFIILALLYKCLLTQAVVPGAPTDVSVSLTRGYIEIKWQPPKENADAVAYYEVHYNPIEHEDRSIIVDKSARQALIAGVLCDTRYAIYVQAFNEDRESSDASSILIVPTGEIKPSAPRNVKGELVKKADISVMWAEPEDNPGAVTEYKVYYKSLSPDNVTMSAIDVGYSTNMSYLQGLLEGTTYEICVTSKNMNYESKPSNIVRVMTSATATTATFTSDFMTDSSSEVNVSETLSRVTSESPKHRLNTTVTAESTASRTSTVSTKLAHSSSTRSNVKRVGNNVIGGASYCHTERRILVILFSLFLFGMVSF